VFCWRDSEVVAEARRRFDAHWAEPSALPSDYKTTVYKLVLKNGGVKEYEEILKTFYATEVVCLVIRAVVLSLTTTCDIVNRTILRKSTQCTV